MVPGWVTAARAQDGWDSSSVDCLWGYPLQPGKMGMIFFLVEDGLSTIGLY